jgi:hypothetical protein
VIDLTEFEAENVSRMGGSCAFQKLELDPKFRAELEYALWQRPDINAKAIMRVLNAHGIKISGPTVSRHRRKDCRCSKP